jgi:hypothetical protein
MNVAIDQPWADIGVIGVDCFLEGAGRRIRDGFNEAIANYDITARLRATGAGIDDGRVGD